MLPRTEDVSENKISQQNQDSKKLQFQNQFSQHGNSEKFDDKTIISHFKQNFQKMKVIKKQSFCRYISNALFSFCQKKSREKRYNWWLSKSRSLITKEMDLKKFILRQRMQT